MERNEWAHITKEKLLGHGNLKQKANNNQIIRYQDKECRLKNTQQLDEHNCKITGKVHSQPEPAIFITVSLELCCWPISKPLLSKAL